MKATFQRSPSQGFYARRRRVDGISGALTRADVGWPLPHHVPTWLEFQGFLLAPMSTPFLLGFFACSCWIT